MYGLGSPEASCNCLQYYLYSYGSHPIITTQYEIVLVWSALHTCAAQHRSDDDKPPMPKSLICSQQRVNLLMVFVMFTQRAINEINLAWRMAIWQKFPALFQVKYGIFHDTKFTIPNDMVSIETLGELSLYWVFHPPDCIEDMAN